MRNMTKSKNIKIDNTKNTSSIINILLSITATLATIYGVYLFIQIITHDYSFDRI